MGFGLRPKCRRRRAYTPYLPARCASDITVACYQIGYAQAPPGARGRSLLDMASLSRMGAHNSSVLHRLISARRASEVVLQAGLCRRGACAGVALKCRRGYFFRVFVGRCFQLTQGIHTWYKSNSRSSDPARGVWCSPGTNHLLHQLA